MGFAAGLKGRRTENGAIYICIVHRDLVVEFIGIGLSICRGTMSFWRVGQEHENVMEQRSWLDKS
jgi:hypothetical protein